MHGIENFVPITKVKSKLLGMVRELHDKDSAFAITKNGVPEAVLISFGKFEGLLETIEVLADLEAMAQIKNSIEDVKQGRLIDVEEAI